MKNFICTLFILMLNSTNVFSLVNMETPISRWVVVGVADYKDGRYFLHEDTVTHELCATYVECLNTSITNLSIPSTVKYEGKNYIVRNIQLSYTGGTNNIRKINIPNSVISIKELICPLLTELKIPNSVKYIGGISCENLTEIILPESVCYIAKSTFSRCKNLEKILIPRKIYWIGDLAFANCKQLREVEWSVNKDNRGYTNLPKTIQDKLLDTVGNNLFDGCENLRTISFPYPIKNIGEFAFNGCKNLCNINIPINGSITKIGKAAFQGCEHLMDINCEQVGVVGVANDKTLFADTIADNAFMGCSNLDVNTIYSKFIGNCAFMSCKNLERVSLFLTTYLGDNAFASCSRLKKLCAPGVKYIGDMCFWYDENLETVDGITSSVRFGGSISGIFALAKVDYIPFERAYKIFATPMVESMIAEWEKKGEYETIADWKKRVTPQTLEIKVKSAMDSAKVSYIKKYAPEILKGEIESYDADNSVFKIRIDNLNCYTNKGIARKLLSNQYIYAKVPANEAPAFRDNWHDVKLFPEYCICKDYLGVSSCEFVLNGKSYDSPLLYDDETAVLGIKPATLDIWNEENPSGMKNVVNDIVDTQIPECRTILNNSFAIIIGNEKYQKVTKVECANNDAVVFSQYCKKTLGMPEKNVRFYPDATYATMLAAIDDIKNIAKVYKGNLNVIFYYAGHGIPDESNRDAYLLPVDTDGKNMAVCYPLSKLYQELGTMNAKSVIVFMDACFSGSQRGEGMLASARGVAIKANPAAPQGNMVVFSAASGDETAYPYKEKNHGLFTYFLLKKLQETKGAVTLGELGNYIIDNVAKESVVSNGKSQTPTVMASSTIENNWKEFVIK